MAKTAKKLTSELLLEYYTAHVLEHGEQPKSVYTFAKHNGFEEQEFYQFFGSFEAIENDIFGLLFDSTISTIEKSKTYKAADARNKLLTFYYTYFENLTANRSLTKYLLEKENNQLKNLRVLKSLRTKFQSFIANIGIEMMDLPEEKLQNAQQNALAESSWVQLLLTLKFWLDDQSASFEKTDIFIEKAVNTSFELMNTKPLQSLLDFGKFVLQERTGMFTNKKGK